MEKALGSWLTFHLRDLEREETSLVIQINRPELAEWKQAAWQSLDQPRLIWLVGFISVVVRRHGLIM